MSKVQLEAELLRSGRYVVRPKGTLGTCGSGWQAIFVNASNPRSAIIKAKQVNIDNNLQAWRRFEEESNNGR